MRLAFFGSTAPSVFPLCRRLSCTCVLRCYHTEQGPLSSFCHEQPAFSCCLVLCGSRGCWRKQTGGPMKCRRGACSKQTTKNFPFWFLLQLESFSPETVGAVSAAFHSSGRAAPGALQGKVEMECGNRLKVSGGFFFLPQMGSGSSEKK